MNCHSIRRKLPVAGSAGKGSKKIVLFLAALICTVCMTGFTAKAASVEGNVRHSRSIAVQTRETIRVQKIRLKQAVLEKEQEIRRQKIRAKREARKKQEQKKLKKQQELLLLLQGNGINTDYFLENTQGSLISQSKDEQMFTLQHWYEGQECSTRSREDILKSVGTLAKLHNVMKMCEKFAENT